MLPGARDSYINLGRFYDSGRLEKRRAELTELTRRYKNAYALAYDYLAAAGALKIGGDRHASEESVAAAVSNCTALLPAAAPGSGSTRSCFMDAFCCWGEVSLLEKLEDWKVYSISAAPADGDAVLRALGKTLQKNAYSVIYCPSPFDPSLLLHLLLPCSKTAFTISRVPESTCAAALAHPKGDDALASHHHKLLTSAGEMLQHAKRSHDALEDVYNPCVDFSGIYSEAKKHINTIL